MNQSNVNRVMFEVLNEFREINAPKVNMWSLSDKYAYPPFFRFTFKHASQEDNIYQHLRDIVSKFKGELFWEMICHPEKGHNYFILPKAFSPFVFRDNFNYEKISFLDFLSQEEYESTIDKAIKDVPNLARFISDELSKGRYVKVSRH